MSGHTPGPWRAFCGRSNTQVTRDSQGSGDKTGSVSICHIAGAKDDDIRAFNGARWEADARLIAAAPELLAALVAAVDCGIVPKSSAHEGGAVRFSRQVEVADQIRAAIAKAKGAQS